MIVPMMNIGVVRVSVLNRVVPVRVGMRLLTVPLGGVLMLMVRVVDVGVFVFQGSVAVPMRVYFGKVQPYARDHEQSGDQQTARHWSAEGHCE